MPRKTVHGGFTLTDLMVSLALLVLLATFAIAGPIANIIERSNRIICEKNLHNLGMAMLIYSNEEKNALFPRVRFDPDNPKPKFFTHPDASSSFGEGAPDPNDVTAALFLLMRTQNIVPKLFVCPSTQAQPWKAATGKTVKDYANFRSLATLSYSMANPYSGKDGVAAGFKWNNALPSEFALAGDLNPGGQTLKSLLPTSPDAEQRKGNSSNHARDGQNVLYADGHVEFQTTPFCGVPVMGDVLGRDNIYTFGRCTKQGTGGIVGPPMMGNDSVLLPIDDGSATTRPTTAPSGKP